MSLVELPGFEEAVRRHTYTGTRSIVPYSGTRYCSRCSVGQLVPAGRFTQHALFQHGGYGEGRAETSMLCLACGHVLVVRVESVRPPR